MTDSTPARPFGDRCFVIAEVGLTHDGSLGQAHAFIDAIARTGANAVKFQTHIAAAESTPAEPFRVAFSRQDASRYEYWRRMEFTEDQWRGLADHAHERGLTFLSSPFSIEAMDLLSRTGMTMWKIASGEVGNLQMLDRAAASGYPVILSSGMSPMDELDTAIQRLRRRAAPVAVLQCTTAYPCPAERVGLNMLATFRERFGCTVGLSDHSGTIYPGLAAVVLGAEIVEVHVTLSRDMFGPDVVASLTMDEMTQLVEGIRFIERMLMHPVDKGAEAVGAESLRRMFTKSVVVTRALDVGAILHAGVLAVKKPGTGIPGSRLADVVGRRLRRAVEADTVLQADDVEGFER